MRATLSDPAHQQRLDQFGFTVFDALDAKRLQQLREVHAKCGVAPDDPRVALHFGFHSRDERYKRASAQAILPVVQDMVRELFDDHEVYLPIFITKWPGPDSGFGPHQDPTLVDERRFRGVSMWIPLDDTGVIGGRDNGMLHVVPGSHRFVKTIRTRDVDQFSFARHESAILDGLGVGIPTRLGQAIVFDNRLIHYSLPNETNVPRVVVSLGIRPREASCVMVRESGEGRIEMFAMDADRYMDVVAAALYLWDPESDPIASFEPTDEAFTPREFAEMCRSVGQAPGSVPAARRRADSARSIDPGIFCAFCGKTSAVTEKDRDGLSKAQLLCVTCREELESEIGPSTGPEDDEEGLCSTPTASPGRWVVVGGSPDGSPADDSLLALVRGLRDRGASVSAVMLLDGDRRDRWIENVDRLVVVDDLRRWPPAVALDRVGAERAAGKLRGARLRMRLAALGHVDVAVLHGGFGGRALDGLSRPPGITIGVWIDGGVPTVSDADAVSPDLGIAAATDAGSITAGHTKVLRLSSAPADQLIAAVRGQSGCESAQRNPAG